MTTAYNRRKKTISKTERLELTQNTRAISPRLVEKQQRVARIRLIRAETLQRREERAKRGITSSGRSIRSLFKSLFG